MTTLTSKFEYCFSQKVFAFSFNCSGELCSYLESYPDTTCVKAGTLLSCNNGITCDEPSNYTSEQSLSQSGPKFLRNESVILRDFCQEYTFVSDGTVGGSHTESQSLADCEPKPWALGQAPISGSSHTATVTTAPPPTQSTTIAATATSEGGPTSMLTSTTGKISSSSTTGSGSSNPTTVASSASRTNLSLSGLLLTFFLLANLFIGGALASTPSIPPVGLDYSRNFGEAALSISNHSQYRRDDIFPELDEFVGILAEYYGGVLNKANHGKGPIAEHGILCEVIGFACDYFLVRVLDLGTAGGVEAFIDGCATLIVEMATVEPPMELLAILGAKTFCNWIFNEAFGPFLEEGKEKMCKPVEEGCREIFGEEKTEAMFHPVNVIDLMGDPKNCGEVGKLCPEDSSCVGGACTCPSCEDAESNSTPCGTQDGCICATDTASVNFCIQDASSCGETIGLVPDRCEDSVTDCPSGYICAVSPRCGNKICLNAGICLGNGFDSQDEQEHVTTQSTAPNTASSTEPTTASSTEPTTASSTEPTTASSTEPTTASSTEPTTASSTEPTTASSTAPTTTPSAAPTSTQILQSFPPDVTPASTQLSGWQFRLLDGSGYGVSDDDYFPPSFLAYDGKKTVNTLCLHWDELDEALPDQTIHANVPFSFETRLTPNTDTCCLALFGGTDCDPSTEQWQHVCDYTDDRKDAVTQFVVRAFQVYNCKGLE